MMDTIKVFVACTASEWLPMKVLEHSIRETTRHDVAVVAISSFGRQIPIPRDTKNKPRTPFSFQRFLIPELCGFKGRAIYLDADMQVFTDMAEVWEADMGQHDLLTVTEGTGVRKGQYSVVLLDCERLAWRIEDIVQALDAGRYDYEQLMYGMCVANNIGHVLSPAWNSLEAYEPGSTRLLHYTDMNTQPWVSLANPLGQLWVDCLKRAMATGFISADDLDREIKLGHVRPSLKLELASSVAELEDKRRADQDFIAPYKLMKSRITQPRFWLGRALKERGRQVVLAWKKR